MRYPPPPLERMWARSIVTESGCWEWRGARNHGGYGQITVARRQYRIHRFAYELLVGPILGELTVDHLCRNRACWRPEHLELTTIAENVRRAPDSPSTQNASKTHCLRGHPFTGENLIVRPLPDGGTGRDCRICRRQRDRERKRAQRAKKAIA